jgi:hypothetical protein
MTQDDISAGRIANQQLIGNKLKTTVALVEWLGAVQSQDFPGAKWALGQRLGIDDKQIQEEFDEGKILRTHVMRPTWHFVAPQDLVWMEKLTSPRVNQIMNYYNKILGLDRNFLDKTNKIIAKALSGNHFLTRTELAKVLEKNDISIKGQKLGHVVSQAELDGLICSGPRVGKQFTYALVSDRTSGLKIFKPADPLAELAKRFFQSHGPATVKDFVWWSGLTTIEAKRGIESNKLKSETVDGKTYWFFDEPNHTKYSTPDTVYLLPNYDEYTIAYQDREAFLPKHAISYFHNQGNASFWNAIIYKGKIIGMWKRTFKPKSVEIQTQILTNLPPGVNKKIKAEAEKCGKFFGLEVVLKT